MVIILFMIASGKICSQGKRLDSMLRAYRSDSLNAAPSLLNSIGGEYYIRYDLEGYNNSLKFHQRALDAAKKNNDSNQIAISYRLIAAVYDAINMNLDTAYEYYNNYLQYELSLKDTSRIIDGYRNLLVMNYKLKNDSAELAVANKLYTYLGTYKGSDNKNFRNMLSIFYSQKRMMARAKEMFTEINVDESAIGNPENFRNYYYAGHFLFQAQEQYREGASFLMAMLGKARLAADSISITKFLSEHYESMGDYKNAFAMLETSTSLANKYINDADRNKIAETASFYLNAQKEKERIFFKEKADSESKIKNYSMVVLVLLAMVILIIAYFSYRTGLQNKALKIQRNELHKLNEEKTLYLKEIHHRVKNNLQIISSMLDLQMHDVTDLRTKDALKEMQMRVYSMAIVHKNLYEKDDLNRIDLQFYFENLFSTICSAFNDPGKSISFRSETGTISLGIDYAIPLGLIVSELMTNSLKYGFLKKNEGELGLRITEKENGLYEFVYSDNGSGFEKNIDPESVHSFGLKLVRLMAKKLKGTLNFESNEKGVSFFFNFKVKE